MSESVHAKVIFRAAQARGGAAELARALGVSLHDVQAWMRSEKPVPDRVLGEILDVLAEDVLRELEGGVKPPRSH